MAEQREAFGSIAFEAERRRLQRLARALLREEAGAEDAVQDAWLALLRAREDEPRDPRAWLAATVRRIARSQRRESSRRTRREHDAARAEAEPAVDESVGRIEVLRRVLNAVEALEEPYRGAIVQRFFDGLPPRTIARRNGVPVATVRTHVRRGLERLRKELDARCEDERSRERFLAALLPIAGTKPWAIGTASLLEPIARGGTLVMTWKARTWIVALFACGAGGWLALESGEGEAAHRAAAVLPGATRVESATELAAAPAAANEAHSTDQRVAAAPERELVVRGTVTLARREPLPDVPLVLRLHAGSSTEAEVVAEGRVRTDGTGRFAWRAIDVSDVATLAIEAVSDDLSLSFSPLQVSDARAPLELVLVVFPLDASLLGRVLEPEGAPVVGARVRSATSETATGADGSFRLRASSESAIHQCRVVKPGFDILRFELTRRPSGDWPVGDLVLQRATALHGRLVDEGGAPVASADVSSYFHRDRNVRTSEDGRFTIDWMTTGSRQRSVVAHAQGFPEQHRTVSEHEIEAGAFEWTLLRGTRLSGVVRDADGHTVGGAYVFVSSRASMVPDAETWSDPVGRFELPPTRRGATRVWAQHEGYCAGSVSVIVPRGHESSNSIELVLSRGEFLAGQVVDDLGRPVPFALVYWEGAARAVREDADAAGRFRVEDLAPGPLRLGFIHRGFERHEERFETLGREDLVIRLRRSGAIAGRVTDGATGTAVQAFRVRFVAPSELSGYWAGWSGDGTGVPFVGTDGYWSTAGSEELRVGAVTGIEVLADGYGSVVASATVAPEPDPDAFVIELFEADASVRGEVVAQESGTPIEGAQVKLFRGQHERNAKPVAEAMTDSAGRFAFDALAVGKTSLMVEHPRWARAIDGPFDLRAGERAARQIALEARSRIVGRLLDADGVPLAGESLELHSLGTANADEPKRELRTDSTGTFEFGGLDPGYYQISWTRAVGMATANLLSRLVHVEAGAVETALELRPLGRASIRGTLTGDVPAMGSVYVLLQAEESPQLSNDSAERISRTQIAVCQDGSFTFQHLRPGRYVVRTLIDWNARVEVDVPEEGQVSIVLALQEPLAPELSR